MGWSPWTMESIWSKCSLIKIKITTLFDSLVQNSSFSLSCKNTESTFSLSLSPQALDTSASINPRTATFLPRQNGLLGNYQPYHYLNKITYVCQFNCLQVSVVFLSQQVMRLQTFCIFIYFKVQLAQLMKSL